MTRAALLAALALAVAPAGASAAAPCIEPDHAGGEWPSYGADVRNSRSQPAMTAVTAATAGALAPAFIYEAPGLISNTPVTGGGCLYVVSQGASTAVAHVAALDADDGTPVWTRDLQAGTAAFGGPAVSSPALAGDLLLVGVNKQGAPALMGLDRSTGAERWRTTIDTQERTGINGSPVVFDGMAMIGFFGNAGPGTAERGGYVLVDLATGELLERTYVIGDQDFAAGHAGAGIWSTPAIDTENGYAYAGTSNPHNPQMEHARSNAILKIDVDRSRETFGEIVASYKGLHDTIAPGGQEQPVCDAKPDVYYYSRFSATCLAADVDFGASPNLYEDASGALRVGELQKAGVYHVVDAGDMRQVARTVVGAPCFACNAGSSAFAGGRAFVAAGPPGQVLGLDGTAGTPDWAAPLASGFTYNPVSVAGGIVWTVDALGFLDGFDAETGDPVVKRRLQNDTGVSMAEATTAAGVALARDTVYAAATTFVLALRPAT